MNNFKPLPPRRRPQNVSNNRQRQNRHKKQQSNFFKRALVLLLIVFIIVLTIFSTSFWNTSREEIPYTSPLFLVSPHLMLENPDSPLSIDTYCDIPPDPSIYLNNDTPTISDISTTGLDQLLSRWGNNIGIHFECINSGFVYAHNGDRQFFGASVSKAVLALQFYMLADAGEIDLDQTLRASANHARHGSMSYGERITIRRLIAMNLYLSDNGATLMLRDFLGNGSATAGMQRYRQFVSNLGANPNFVRNSVMDSVLTASQAALFARAIHEYIEGENPNSEEFRRYLTSNAHPFLFLDSPLSVASKTGWWDGHLNDMTIVYLEGRPFILTMLTSGRTPLRGSTTNSVRQQDRNDFALISDAFLNFQRSRDIGGE
ncbi:MAG: class A beta-lactamase-related serine hydrolase [Oscillospiraceae bacterium]|nr:class A beta-lactamase-related serine hydrolase [Oscillospiraceae bacterium]